ncbi:uronase [Aquimarina sp. W85]|uniref:uronase n=1 Tax=Aquimarina rhodophyticola TaxID=3342246 RepID=UPI003671C0DE
MRKIHFSLLALPLALLFVLTSCNQDSIQDEIENQSQLKNLSSLDYTARISRACDFSLTSLSPNSNISINCTVDLNGETVKLPPNIKLTFDGGDVVNGTLDFSGGEIAGELLNSSLKIIGNVSLIENVVNLIPSRWDITEGNTSSTLALKNRDMLELAINTVKQLDGTTLQIDTMDAYFEISKMTSNTENRNFYPSIEAINIPSNFNLIMSENTHLRVYPNGSYKNSLLAMRDVKNVTVKGGNLHGDRDQHNYSSGGSHEWGHLIDIHAGNNIEISNIKIQNATGDGMKIHALNFVFEDNYRPSSQIKVLNCTFDSNRRNNLSITDGHHILVEGNTFLNAGVDTQNSKGTNPKFALDIEATRKRDANGTMVYYERAYNITVRNNIERGSEKGGFIVFIGENVIFEGNSMENSISWSFTNGTKIRNNEFKRISDKSSSTAIVGGRPDNMLSTYNNQISGNKIYGYSSGITVFGRKNKVFSNLIENCDQGIFLRVLEDSRLYANTINSTVSGSKGFFGHMTSMKNVYIYNSHVSVVSDPFKFVRVNYQSDEANNTFILRHNKFNSNARAVISDTRGLTMQYNTMSNETTIYNSSKIDLLNNTINTSSTKGFYLRQVNRDINLDGNKIKVRDTRSSQCIKIESSTSRHEITENNNSCSV